LAERQKGQIETQRFYLSDIESVLSEKHFSELPEGFTLKVVIQKANFDVARSTVANGYTTRLLFLTKETGKEGDWYLYGFAKGLFKNLELLDVNKDRPLGWSLYISLFEKDTDLSGSISKLEKLKKRFRKINSVRAI
jgi:hypothetical protein